ncbi:chemotaxis protein CheW [Aquabacterium sp. OR-4]|uniref:chemotaxis protein CheW n=1 Tax=Aquabacterium sp. OR-4 TaxID=2978127 RepID=UPI0021B4C455|nr:chemotaxis protein CheW [Aquabacterium sp. OR-4]MDT7835617.1 chemotaxis protein CheW [Aquabacterium sp. OR-4]
MSLADELIPYMRRVQAAERDLRDLNLLWQMIEASSAISCPEEAESILPMLTQTRVRFASLQKRLVSQLAGECVAELRDELAASAQCTIDILVRNLFERTADVGFLATDGPVCAFCAAPADVRAGLRGELERRLGEYRDKYTVYDDILLLSPRGELLARLDSSQPLSHSHDEIVGQAAVARGYVERFGASDLAPDGQPALLYGHAVHDAAGHCCGVLVLRFRSHDELIRIFDSVVQPTRNVAVVLLDAGDRVIASNDPAHIPVAARLHPAADGQVGLTSFGGREYLSVTRATHGYQGYTGPKGWRAQAMTSVLTAFRDRNGDAERFDALPLGNEDLARIQHEVDAINGDLRRVVWNGRLAAGTRDGEQARLKAVLRQINEAGSRTRESVALAIRNLYRSAIGRIGHQSGDLARLAADILDRNLYERANDCRWWALSPVLEQALAEGSGDEVADAETLQHVLAHINSLYTVYARLVVFDTQGCVRGVSREAADGLPPLTGSRVEPALTQLVATLGDGQRYAVTPYAASALSDGVPAWCYVAAVRGGPQRRTVGGIAIVFNTERELRAMLDDVLGDSAGMAAFVDAQGRVMVSTTEAWPAGQLLAQREHGAVFEQDGAQYTLARVGTHGYREFKQHDGYEHGVQVVVALRLGPVERRRGQQHEVNLQALPTTRRSEQREYALFSVGAGRFALPAGLLIEARPRTGLVNARMGMADMAGLLEVPDQRSSRVVPVLNMRAMLGVHYAPRAADGVVLVLGTHAQPGRPSLGLLVDDVSAVLDIGPEHLQPVPPGMGMRSTLLGGLLRLGCGQADGGEVLVQLLNAEALGAMVLPDLAAA